MATCLVNYATERFFESQARLNASALRYGIDRIFAFRTEQLEQTAFFREYRRVLEQPRGAGCYLWKPYFVQEALKRLGDGDVLIYLDSGIEILDSLEPLVQLCRRQEGVLLFACHGHANGIWTKRDCFVRLGCDEPRFHAAEQVSAGFLVLEKNRRSEAFVQDWLDACTIPDVINDDPNTCGLPNLEGFQEHRHDQSVLSLLAEREGIPRFRDPSQWGNHLKLHEYRTPGEFVAAPYVAVPDARSHYGTLFDLHRLGPRASGEALTILVGHHNSWPELEDTIRSVAAQTNGNWHCLILDDGSDDGSAELLHDHPLIVSDPRFCLIARAHRAGAARTLAELIAQAETSIVGVLNAGDALHPECVNRVLCAYGEAEREFVYTNFVWCDSTLEPQQLGFCRPLSPGQTTVDHGCISHFKTFRKSAYERTAGIDETLEWAYDADLIYKLEEVAEPHFLDEPLYLHRAPGEHGISRAERARRACAEDAYAKRQAVIRRKQSEENISWAEPPVSELTGLISSTVERGLWIRIGSAEAGAPLSRIASPKFTHWDFDPAAKGEPDALLPRSEDQYDAIVCDGFDRLQSPEAFLEAVRRLLSDRGMLITRIKNARDEQVLSALLHGEWLGDLDDPQRIRYFTRREAEKLFARCGFEIVEIQPCGDSSARQLSDQSRERGRLSELVSAQDPSLAEDLRAARYVIAVRPKSIPQYGLTSIVILTHNQLPFTRRCIDSLRLRTDEPVELICVDNGSTDGTLDYLRSLDGVQVIANAENKGFPAGMNQGIRAAHGDQILLLNNDTILTTGWLTRMLAALHSAPDIGIVGPASNNVSGVQQVPVTYSSETEIDGFAWGWGKVHDRRWHTVDRLVGFCFLFRRELVERIGLLDEQFGIGCFEDDDYSRRAMAAGYRLLFAQDAFVHHVGSQTFRESRADLAAILRENGDKFAAKWNSTTPDEPLASLEPQTLAKPVSLGRRDLVLRSAPTGGLLLAQRPRLSLCMIVRDNERTLEACLESIRPWVDEMIVVDTGSRDRTPEIAQRYGARLFEFPWCDDFAAARNESLKHARGEWIFWMDSDDSISPECGRQLRELADREHPPHILGYIMQVHCPGEDREHDVTVVDHVKLFRNRRDLKFEGRIHEQIIPAIRRAGGDVAWTDIHVVHSGSEHSAESRARKLERDFRILHLELRDQPDHPFVLFNLGMTHADAEQYEQAIHFLRRCLEVSNPQESHVRKAYALLISALSQSGQHPEAEETCDRGLALFPEDKELQFRSALLFHHRGRLKEAEHAYLRVLNEAEERHFTSIDQGLAGFKARHNLALVYEDQGNLPKAEGEWRRITSERPQYRPAWRGLGEILLRLEDLSAVRRLIHDLQTQSDLRGEDLWLAGRLAECCQDLKLAERYFVQAEEYAPTAEEACRGLARVYFGSGHLVESEAALLRLLKHNPEDPVALANLGTVSACRGEHERAIAAYRNSLELRPDHAPTRNQLALSLERL
jgi:GT2 family glycosyltransferase/tetratricopeptide (TPR) repeat protein